MPTSTLTSKGQTTIPREVRDFLKVKSGDRLEFAFNADGKSVTIHPANVDISSLRGILKRQNLKPFDPNERSLAFRNRSGRT